MIHFYKNIEDLSTDGIKGVTYLTNLEVENRTNEAYIAKEKLFSSPTLFSTEGELNLFLDLSQVRFAELSALHLLLLQIDRICKDNIIQEFYVALPTIENTQKEIESEKLSQEKKGLFKKRRIGANSFIKNVNFIGALKICLSAYNIIPYFTQEFEFSSEIKPDDFKKAFEEIKTIDKQTPKDYEFLYPLRWFIIGEDDRIDYTALDESFKKILSNDQRGLHNIDVNIIKNVLFYELRKNVIEHTNNYKSNPKRFLFSMGLIKRTNNERRDDDDKKEKAKKRKGIDDGYEVEKSFYELLEEKEIPSLVEIYFGDTGGGFFTKEYIQKAESENCTGKNQQLKWAFKRWSTRNNGEKRRGTKGLYRIARVANKYNGIVEVYTNDIQGEIFNGDWGHRKSHQLFKGAFLQIRLWPYSEVKKFQFESQTIKRNRKWKTVTLDLSEYNKQIEGRVIINDDGEINEIIQGSLEQKIQSIFQESEEKNYFFIIDLDKLKYQSDEFTLMLEPLISFSLKTISYFSHPSSAIVYVNSREGSQTISNIVDTVNVALNEKEKEHISSSSGLSKIGPNEDIYDPIIVISGEEINWYGGDTTIIEILKELYNNNFEKSLVELNSFKFIPEPDKKDRIKLYFSKDSKLVITDPKDWKIKLNFINLQQHFSDLFLEREKELERNDKYGFICTPKLELIEHWIDVKELIRENEHGFALSLYLKLIEEEKKGTFSLDEELFILIDHSQHKSLAIAFSKLLPNLSEDRIINIQEQIQLKSLKRFKLFREGSKVIILTSLIASSETIRRMVKYVWRDNAVPLAILCLGNYRKENITSMKTWGVSTNILSVFQENNRKDYNQPRDVLEYFKGKEGDLNAYLKDKKPIVQPDYSIVGYSDNPLISNELLYTFKKTKSLHYSHIGIKNDRHFTFYINKSHLLKEDSFLWVQISSLINKWKFEKKINDFTLFVKEDLVSKDSEHKFYNFLKTHSSQVITFKKLPPIIGTKEKSDIRGSSPQKGSREKPKLLLQENSLNYFIIDFGIISGESINTYLNQVSKINNLFICIIFNQEKVNKVEHYKRISALSELDKGYTDINVKIGFLQDLPLSYYSIDNCPICNHLEALDVYKMSNYPEDYMFKFSEDRQERLKLIPKDFIENQEYPFDFYFLEDIMGERRKNFKKHTLSSELVNKMFSIKALLNDALNNTYSRIKLYNLIFNEYEHRETHIKQEESYLYALIYLLSFEVHWFQKEPLIFKDFRAMLSEIALYIATFSFEKLESDFKEESKANPNGLTVRYKYAAISVLRSTNKLKFCERAFEIVSNSCYDNRFSNNLIQNIFYHTYSIMKNRYNRSLRYFTELKESYKKIRMISSISEDQKKVSSRLYLLLHTKLTEIDIESLDDIGLIKRAKELTDEKYDTKNHPPLQENLMDLVLENISEDALRDIETNKENSPRFFQFKPVILNANLKWQETQIYIYESIIPIYKNLSDGIKNSNVFKDEYQLLDTFESIIPSNYKNYLFKFSDFIREFVNNPFIYLQKKKEYDFILHFLLERIIKEKSNYLSFLSQFPLDINAFFQNNESLEWNFGKFDFQSSSQSLVFYPINEFRKHIDLIVKSIKERIRPEFKQTEDFNGAFLGKIHFKVQVYNEGEKFTVLHLSYNGTFDTRHNHAKNKIGGLESIKNEVMNFGGNVYFDTSNDKEGFFHLKFNFLRYE